MATPPETHPPADGLADAGDPCPVGVLDYAGDTVLDKNPTQLSSFRRGSAAHLSTLNYSAPSGAPVVGISRIIDGDTVVATSGEHFRLVGLRHAGEG